LKTGFCEIRFPKPAPVKASGGITIKQTREILPRKPETLLLQPVAKVYFHGDIHTNDCQPNRQRATMEN
jgi:hypothetical protein